jgi:hypothetical protein
MAGDAARLVECLRHARALLAEEAGHAAVLGDTYRAFGLDLEVGKIDHELGKWDGPDQNHTEAGA